VSEKHVEIYDRLSHLPTCNCRDCARHIRKMEAEVNVESTDYKYCRKHHKLYMDVCIKCLME